jgi:hypothetical protein
MLMERGDPTVGETVNIVTADVHTTPTDMGGAPVGWVKHVGTGYPNLGVFVVQRDIHNATAYVGPVMSFYEHTTEHFERLNDAQWKQAIDAGSYPRPDWVNVYLADSDGKRLPIGPSLATGTPARREPLLTCTASAPGITAIPREQRYDPMPFPVTATVKNIGNALSDSVFVSILLPPELSLAGVDAPDKSSKLLQPAQLFPNASGSVQWLIAHPLTKEEKCYTVQVSTVAANAPASTCEVEVVIPAMRYPHLAIGPHSVPNALIFVDSLDQYVPNPFPIRFSCMNQGNDIARNVSGTLDLPEHMEFDPPTQSATQYFTPTDMQPWKTGDSIPELLWTVRWNTRLRIDEKAEVRFVVSGEDAEGHALDSTDHRSLISIPGLQPELSCDMEIPDSLSLRSDGTGVEPNPFTVRYIVRNNSHQTGKVRQVVLYFPANEGLRLSPSSPNPMSFRSDWILHPGEEVTYEWFVDVDNRLTRRNIQVQIIGYDDEGNSLPCDDWLPIAALGAGSISATTTTSASVLHYDQASDSYSPSTFTYTGRLRTSGYMTLQDIEARMYWEDPSGLDLIEPDPSVADTTNPKTWSELGTNEEAEFTWGFRLKNRNTSGIPQYLHFFIDFTATNLPRHTVDSSGGFVEVEPVYTLGVDHPAATDLFTLHANHPNPFSGHSTISFELTRRAHVRLTVHNMLGEVVAVLVDDASEPGHHSCVFLPAGLPPGMYLYRLQAGGMLRSRTMLLLE